MRWGKSVKFTSRVAMAMLASALASLGWIDIAAAAPMESKVPPNYTWLPGHPPNLSHHRRPTPIHTCPPECSWRQARTTIKRQPRNPTPHLSH
jgi:hypothetical protein